MGILDNVKKMADKEKLKKVSKQAQEKIDQAQEKIGGSGKKREDEPGAEPQDGEQAQQNS